MNYKLDNNSDRLAVLELVANSPGGKMPAYIVNAVADDDTVNRFNDERLAMNHIGKRRKCNPLYLFNRCDLLFGDATGDRDGFQTSTTLGDAAIDAQLGLDPKGRETVAVWSAERVFESDLDECSPGVVTLQTLYDELMKRDETCYAKYVSDAMYLLTNRRPSEPVYDMLDGDAPVYNVDYVMPDGSSGHIHWLANGGEITLSELQRQKAAFLKMLRDAGCTNVASELND